jgi:pyruvate carboxylase subunit B
VPKLVDTTIRLLSQEPLAGRLPTAEVLRVAEILDKAGFAYHEVSGGGVFDATVRRRVEVRGSGSARSGAGIHAAGHRAARTFLVGSRPVSGDIVGHRLVAAENGIDVFRLHDPLNDVSNLREAGLRSPAPHVSHSSSGGSPAGRRPALVEQARKLPDLGATRIW